MPNPGPTIAAHLILGSRDEPFLSAMLESIGGVASIPSSTKLARSIAPRADARSEPLRGSKAG